MPYSQLHRLGFTAFCLVSACFCPGISAHGRKGTAPSAPFRQPLTKGEKVQHALNRNAVSRGFEARDPADAVGQRLAVVRTGAPGERAVDIEEDQRFVAQ